MTHHADNPGCYTPTGSRLGQQAARRAPAAASGAYVQGAPLRGHSDGDRLEGHGGPRRDPRADAGCGRAAGRRLARQAPGGPGAPDPGRPLLVGQRCRRQRGWGATTSSRTSAWRRSKHRETLGACRGGLSSRRQPRSLRGGQRSSWDRAGQGQTQRTR